MSPWLIRLLIVQYLIISAVSVIEAAWYGRPERWAWALYFAAAALISVAVLWMGNVPCR